MHYQQLTDTPATFDRNILAKVLAKCKYRPMVLTDGIINLNNMSTDTQPILSWQN